VQSTNFAKGLLEKSGLRGWMDAALERAEDRAPFRLDDESPLRQRGCRVLSTAYLKLRETTSKKSWPDSLHDLHRGPQL
jgi:hypothetical protein